MAIITPVSYLIAAGKQWWNFGSVSDEKTLGVRFTGRKDQRALIANEGVISLFSMMERKTLFTVDDRRLRWLYLPRFFAE